MSKVFALSSHKKKSCACKYAKVRKYFMKEWASMCAKSHKLNPN